MPRKPYRSPRDWLHPDQTRLFGNDSAQRLTWHTPQSDLEQALLTAAQQQNDLAFTVRVSGGRRMPTPALAIFADLHPDTVRDILNGSKHATLAVLHALTVGVGRELTIASSKGDRQSPEGHST